MLKKHAYTIIIPAITIITTAVLFLSYAIYDKVEDSLSDIAISKISILLDNTITEVKSDLDDAKALQTAIIENGEVLQLLKTPNDNVQLQKVSQSLLLLIKSSQSAIALLDSIAIFPAKGNSLIHLDTKGIIQENLTPLFNNSYYENDTKQNKSIQFHNSSHNHKVYSTFPLYSNGIFLGSVEFYINVPIISKLVQQYASKISESAILVVGNRDGEIICTSAYPNLVQSNSITEFEDILIETNPDERKLITSLYIPEYKISIGLYQSVNRLAKVNNYIRNEVITIITITILFSTLGTYVLLNLLLRRHIKDEQKLVKAIELLDLPMWEYNAPGIINFNEHSFKLLGREAQSRNLDLEALDDLIHPEDRRGGLFAPSHPTTKETDIFYDGPLRFAHADGHWHWLHVKGHAVRSNTGIIQHGTGIFIDVHEWHVKIERDKAYQRSLEKVVQEQYERAQKNDDLILYEKSLLYNVINCIPDFIYFKEVDGRILGGNKAFLNLLGCQVSEIRGKRFREIDVEFSFNEEDFEFFNKNEDILGDSEVISHKDVTLIYKNGNTLPLEMFKVAFRDHLGNAIGIVTVGSDITERLASETILREANDTATASNLAKSEFLANMSHEIRTPLNGILGLNHLALQHASPHLRTYLEKIDISAKTLLKIVNDILDFSKIESGKIEVEHIPFRIARSIQFAIDMLQYQADEKNISLQLVTVGEIPEYILGDPLRFRQALLNLLNNAVKFTHQGGVTITITTSQEIALQADINIDISDTGIGMSNEQINIIFQPFIQADSTTTRRYGGTGLGLPITRSLIEAMGSELTVTSKEGEGTTFNFTLHAKIPLDLSADKSAADQNDFNFEHIKEKNILLVEDNEINQLIATEILENLGLNVTIATNGQQGVDLALHGNFDLVLMDIQMPIMDGLTAAKTLRYNNFTKPIIAMTANAMPDDIVKASESGMQEHIGKPIDINDLHKCLFKWLDDGNTI